MVAPENQMSPGELLEDIDKYSSDSTKTGPLKQLQEGQLKSSQVNPENSRLQSKEQENPESSSVDGSANRGRAAQKKLLERKNSRLSTISSYRESSHYLLKLVSKELVRIIVRFVRGLYPRAFLQRARSCYGLSASCCRAGYDYRGCSCRSGWKSTSSRFVDDKDAEQAIRQLFERPLNEARTRTSYMGMPKGDKWSQEYLPHCFSRESSRRVANDFDIEPYNDLQTPVETPEPIAD